MTETQTTSAAALAAAKKIATVGAAARHIFIDRDQMVMAMEWAFACGEHICVLGPPGTAKSSLTRFFAEATGLSFFRKLLNPDTTRDELVGPIDPLAFDKGIWDRCWSGLATNRIVFLDEVGKSSSQVLNMILDSMEERLVTDGRGDRVIPLHCLIGASNETLGRDLAAIWDRFAIRLVLHRLNEAGKVARLLTRLRGTTTKGELIVSTAPQVTPLTEDDLLALRRQARGMAANPSDAVVETVIKLFAKIATIHEEPISDRRWERLLTVGAGRALIHGRDELLAEDIIVAEHMLWERHTDVDAVRTFVMATVDEESAEIAVQLRMVEELEAERKETKGKGRAEGVALKATINYQAQKRLRALRSRNGTRPEWNEIKRRYEALHEWSLED